MLQLEPDWRQFWTAHQAEEELKNFQFKGPGLYIQKDGFMVVVPASSNLQGQDNWKKNQPSDQVYYFYVYACQFTESVFPWIGVIPCRQDDRE